MEVCDKCLTDQRWYKKYAYCGKEEMNHISLCRLCNSAYEGEINLLAEFMKDDFGKFPVSQESKNMIDARRNRALGKSPWNELQCDNKAEAKAP